jgi:hypothetical protein
MKSKRVKDSSAIIYMPQWIRNIPRDKTDRFVMSPSSDGTGPTNALPPKGSAREKVGIQEESF